MLQPVRLCFSNPHVITESERQLGLEYASRSPFLHTYAAIGQTRALGKVLWYRQQQLLCQRSASDWRARCAALARELHNLHQAAVEIVEMPSNIPDNVLRDILVAHVQNDVVNISACE